MGAYFRSMLRLKQAVAVGRFALSTLSPRGEPPMASAGMDCGSGNRVQLTLSTIIGLLRQMAQFMGF